MQSYSRVCGRAAFWMSYPLQKHVFVGSVHLWYVKMKQSFVPQKRYPSNALKLLFKSLGKWTQSLFFPKRSLSFSFQSSPMHQTGSAGALTCDSEGCGVLWLVFSNWSWRGWSASWWWVMDDGNLSFWWVVVVVVVTVRRPRGQI